MFLFTELIKSFTHLERIHHLDGLVSRLSGKSSEVWALASLKFPKHLLSSESDKYLCFIGISPDKHVSADGVVHFLEFGHECMPEYKYDDRVSILEHMFDIYCEYMSTEERNVILYPRTIDEESVDFWLPIAADAWAIRDRRDFDAFMNSIDFDDLINWDELRRRLPVKHYLSESEYSTDAESEVDSSTDASEDDYTETETELETESETETDTPPQPKRRKVVLYSDSESEEDAS